MHITLIAGSQRQKAQSYKVAKYLQARVMAHPAVTDTDFIDLANDDIPVFDNDAMTEDSHTKRIIAPQIDKLKKADALVLVTPEWGGMVPGHLKNFMLYWQQKDVGHKPVMLTSVSASINGAYPIAELRSSGYKNSKIVYLPDHLIVRNVADMMNDHDPEGGEGFDKDIRQRAEYTINMLTEYAKALKGLRDDPQILNPKYSSGM